MKPNVDPIAYAWRQKHPGPIPKKLEQTNSERAGLAAGAQGKKGKGKHVLSVLV